jgi:thymidylate synthase (FAD)
MDQASVQHFAAIQTREEVLVPSDDIGRGIAVQPHVRIVSENFAFPTELYSYIDSLGATDWDWSSPHISNPEKLIEFFGRLCYKSFGTELNPNITRVRTDSEKYIASIIESGHGSVLEHCNVGVVFQNVSRVFTHELVRHRHGAISQESLRYVRLDHIDYPDPPWEQLFPDDPDKAEEMSAWFGQHMAMLAEWQVEFAKLLELDSQQMPFARKKILTSVMRRLAPIGLATQLGWTSNFRELRHVIQQRTAIHAEHEMRLVIGQLAAQLWQKYPLAFADMTATILDPSEDPFQLPIFTFASYKV